MGNLNYHVKILKKAQLTHNVIRFVLDRPKSYRFTAGQAIELSVDEPEFIHDAAPFTLTGLSSEDSILEIIFKVYPEHRGITWRMSKLTEGDSVLISDAWDSFKYKSEGVFIAGGTGVTPFIAILRELNSCNLLGENRLIFANKTTSDIFLKEELSGLLGSNFINILSEERNDSYSFGLINHDFLSFQITNYNTAFYLCGPGSFSMDIKAHLLKLGANDNFIYSEY